MRILVATDGFEYSKVVIETCSCAVFGVGRPKRSRTSLVAHGSRPDFLREFYVVRTDI